MVVRQSEPFRWESIPVHPYKEEGTHFRAITRQTLLQVGGDMPVELRYFEMDEGGHSTLERHQHQHAVMIIRGKGQVLVDDQITEIGTNDLVHIPPMTWHQFRASLGEPLGFLCVVNCERDRPQRPTPEEVATFQQHPEIGAFIRI